MSIFRIFNRSSSSTTTPFRETAITRAKEWAGGVRRFHVSADGMEGDLLVRKLGRGAVLTNLKTTDGRELIQSRNGNQEMMTPDAAALKQFAKRLASNVQGVDSGGRAHKGMLEAMRLRSAAKAAERLATRGTVETPDWALPALYPMDEKE